MSETPETKLRKSVKIGEVWQLGEHLLGCGDAKDPELVKKIAGGGHQADINGPAIRS